LAPPLGVELLGGGSPRTSLARRPQLEPLDQRVVPAYTRPAAINYQGVLHVFTTGTDGHLYDHYTNDNVHWHWDDHGSVGLEFRFQDCDPAVTTIRVGGFDRLHVFVTGRNGHLYDHWWDGSWHWDDHGDGGAGPTNVMHSPGVMTYWVGG